MLSIIYIPGYHSIPHYQCLCLSVHCITYNNKQVLNNEPLNNYEINRPLKKITCAFRDYIIRMPSIKSSNSKKYLEPLHSFTKLFDPPPTLRQNAKSNPAYHHGWKASREASCPQKGQDHAWSRKIQPRTISRCSTYGNQGHQGCHYSTQRRLGDGTIGTKAGCWIESGYLRGNW